VGGEFYTQGAKNVSPPATIVRNKLSAGDLISS